MLRWLFIVAVVCSCSVSTNRQGGVRVISNIPDAVLYVDEDLRGPVRVFQERYIYVDPGRHRLMLEHPEHFAGRRVGLILSGGNVDLDHLPW